MSEHKQTPTIPGLAVTSDARDMHGKAAALRIDVCGGGMNCGMTL